MIIKLRSECRGDHVHTSIFMGPGDGRLALIGTVAQRFVEWGVFVGVLRLGAEHISSQYPVSVVLECDDALRTKCRGVLGIGID